MADDASENFQEIMSWPLWALRPDLTWVEGGRGQDQYDLCELVGPLSLSETSAQPSNSLTVWAQG